MKKEKAAPARVRDLRVKSKFFIDDAYLNGYARHTGIYATGVYMTICRHASRAQEAFPSYSLMAQKLAISEASVKRAIQTLEDYNIIKVTRRKTGKGTYLPNMYTLLDKSEWKPVHGSDRPMEKPVHGSVRPLEKAPKKRPVKIVKTPVNSDVSEIGRAAVHGSVRPHKDKEKNIKTIAGANPAIKDFIDHAHGTFKNKYGEPLNINGGKDGKIVKVLVETYGLEKLKGLWSDFLTLADNDDFIRNKAGVSIGTFKTQINKLITTSRRPRRVAL